MSNYVLQFEITALPKTYNAIGRSHWTVKAKEAKRWKSLVFGACWNQRPKLPLEKVRVQFTRCSSRLMDPDNVPQTFKHVMDGLVVTKIIVDDKAENIVELSYKQIKVKRGEEKIIIRVEEYSETIKRKTNEKI